MNPKAGSLKYTSRFKTIQELIISHFPNAIFVETAPSLDSISAIRPEAIVACGGDGTIQLVAQTLAGSSIPMGIVPLGSGNDFVKSAGISPRPEIALRQLLQSKTLAVDVITFETDTIKKVCINTLGIGFDGSVNYLRSRNNKKGYIGPVLKAALSQSAFHVNLKTDEASLSTHFLMVTLANGHTEGGNFKLVTKSALYDGYFELITIEPLSTAGLLFRLPLFLFGLQHHSKKINIIKTKSLEITLQEPVYAHADGEQLGQIRSLKAEIIPQSLNLLVPDIDK